MRLLFIGIIEALISIGFGLNFVVSSTRSNHAVGYGLIIMGIIILIATLFLAKPEEKILLNNEEQLQPSEKSNGTSPAMALPASPMTDAEPIAVTRAYLPSPVSYLREERDRARWRYKAADFRLRVANFSHATQKRNVRRVAETVILMQGYESWAEGHAIIIDLTAFTETLSTDVITERLRDLSSELTELQQEGQKWSKPIVDDDGQRDAVIDEHVRFEKLRGVEERLEEITILYQGWRQFLGKGERSATGV